METSLLVSSWAFDGLFQENVELITIDDFKTPEEIVKITALSTYPMRYADPTIGTSLRKQGEMFWKFRNACYVYYSEEDESVETIVSKSDNQIYFSKLANIKFTFRGSPGT